MEVETMLDSEREWEQVFEAAKCAEQELLPNKSKDKYLKAYNEFVTWKNSKKLKSVSETAVMAYFYELSKRFKATSMWSYYSMLKAGLKLNENIDISTYHKLSAFLKSKSVGYTPVKAAVFEKDQIDNFIFTDPDSEWLDVKVVCIFGICGALRTDEMTRIAVTDIEQHGDLYLVHILETKTKVSRSFTIMGAFCDVVKRYWALRSPQMLDKRFFSNHRFGKCTNQVIGKNKFAKMPERMATYLSLPNPKRFTGHSLRRSSATFLANCGGTMERLMRFGGYRSSKTAEGYVEDSLEYKKTTEEMISSFITSAGAASHSMVKPSGNVASENTLTASAVIASWSTVKSEGNVVSEAIVTTQGIASQGFLDHIGNDEVQDMVVGEKISVRPREVFGN